MFSNRAQVNPLTDAVGTERILGSHAGDTAFWVLELDLSISLSIYLSIYLRVYLSIYASTYLCIRLSIYLPTYLPVYLSICLRIELPIHPIYPSICRNLSICIPHNNRDQSQTESPITAQQERPTGWQHPENRTPTVGIPIFYPDPREDPKSKTPNSGLQYSHGVDYRTPKGNTFWIRPGVWVTGYRWAPECVSALLIENLA